MKVSGMKAPKCRVCGIVEWNHVCGGPVVHADPVVVHSPKISSPEPDSSSQAVVHASEPVVHGGVVVRGESRYRDVEKRREYRREWMRKKRAREKK